MCGDCFDNSPSRVFRLNFVSRTLTPLLYGFPVSIQCLVDLARLMPAIFQISHFEESLQIMRVARIDIFLVREVMAACAFCDAGFERALDCVPGEIIRAARVPRPEQGAGLGESRFCKPLEIGSVHLLR